MELIEDSKGRKLYQEDNKTYTMLDMGSYVGHRSRPWYQKHTPVWILMEMDQTTGSDTIHIESLVDDRGNYMRFIIDKGPIRRVILLQYGFVFSDTIVVTSGSKFGPRFAALDGDPYTTPRYPLESYIARPLPYDLKGASLPGDIPSLDILRDYLDVNNRLYNEIINGPEATL